MEFDHRTLGQRVIFGTGAGLANTALALADLGAERVLLIAGASAAGFAESLTSRVNVVDRISEVVQHVPAAHARAAVQRAAAAAADAVVAVGGGSATGLAKMVARDTRLPIIAVPTTFAGSEATDVWGQTEHGRKTTGTDPAVLPAVVVYDAELSASLPTALAMASGLNAVAHAVDGFWAPRADPINAAMGAAGLRALVPGLRLLAASGESMQAREQVLYGAYLAAVAFASAGSGLHHKICHVLGGAFGLDHARMHAIVLPYVTAFNTPHAPEAAARIAEALGVPSPAAGLYALREQLGVAGSLGELGLAETQVPAAAALALEAVPASNPRPVGLADLEQIIARAQAGEPI